MAIIYSYPINTNILATDIIVGSSTAIFNGRPKNQTKSFEIQDLAAYFASVIVPPGSYVPYTGAIGAVNLGVYNLTVNGISVGKGTGSATTNTVVGGNNAGNSLSTGAANAFFGDYSGRFTTTSNFNTFIGYTSGYTNVSGAFNTATGSTTLYFNTTGNYNSAFGLSSSRGNTTGIGNISAGAFSAYSNTTGSYNSHLGYGTAYFMTSGDNNVFLGLYAGRRISGGTNNITSNNSIFLGSNTAALADNQTNQIVIGNSATGAGSNTVTIGDTSIITTRLRGTVQGGSFVKDGGTNLEYLLADGSVSTGPVLTGFVPYTGATQAVNLGAFDLTLNGATIGRGGGQVYSNIVFGLSSLLNNTTGQNNTYVGFSSGYYNTIGSYNSAIGCFASQFNTTGNYNISIGDTALYANTTGSNNIAVGPSALGSNTVGGSNTAIGKSALGFNTVGLQNIAIGNDAGKLLTISGNNTSGNQNIFIGESTTSLTNADTNQIVIGYNAVGAGSNTVVIGNSSITTTRLRGAVQGGSFVKDSGTVYETLLANGSVSTNGTLYKATSTAYQLVSGTSYFYSAVIPSNIFASGDNLKINTITATTAITVSPVIMRYYINTTPSIVGAIQIANWSGNAGSISYPMDRVYWVNGGDFYARNFTSSSPNSSNTGTTAINNTPIPGGSFYIIVEITTTAPDLAGLLNFQIIKS